MKAIRGVFRNLNAVAQASPEAGLAYWRERIYNSMVSAMLVWGLLALIPSIWYSFASGLSGLGIFDLLAYFFLVGLYFLRNSAKYQLRALLLILLGLAVGTVVFFATGDEGAGLFWLFAVPPFASLLLGLSWGLFFSALNIAIMLGIGYIISTGAAQFPLLQEFTLGAWIVYGINFLAANAIVTVPLGALLQGLFSSVERQQTLQRDYQLLFENNPLPMWVYDSETFRFLAVNGAAIAHYGYSLQEFQSMSIKEIRPPEEIPLLEKSLSSRQARQYSGPWKHRKKDGSLIDVEVYSHSIQFANKDARLVLANDVTELKKSELELREREELYRILAENSHTLICTHDLNGRILSVNDVAIQLTGYSRDQILKMTLDEVIAPDWRKFFPRYLSRVTKLGKARGLMQIKTSTGETRIWEYNNVMWVDESGTPIIRGMANDITERVEAQAKLQQADQVLRHVKSLVMVLDRKGEITYVSPSALEMVGIPAEKLLGNGWWQLGYSDSTEAHGEKAFMQRVAKRELPVREQPYERAVRLDNGDIRWIEWQDTLGPDETIIWVGRDITENKKAEEAVHRRLTEQNAIRDVSTSLRAADNLETMLPLLLDSTLQVLNMDKGSVWLYNGAHDYLEIVAVRGYVNEQGQDIKIRPQKPGEGISGFVYSTGRTFNSKEFINDDRIPQYTRELAPPKVGGAAVPIRSEKEILGVIIANVDLPRVVEEHEINLLTTIAEIAGNAIQRSTLHEKTRQQLSQFKALSEIDRAILSSLDLQYNLKLLVENVVQQLHVDAANVMLFDPVRQALNAVQGEGFRTQAFEGRRIDLGEGYAGKAAAERRIIHVDQLQIQRDNPRLAKALAGEGFTSYYGLPLIAKGELRGVLEIFHRGSLGPDEEWFGLLNALAARAALAIDTIKTLDNLERANQDLILSYDATIEGWSRALDLRDHETEGHSQRVTQLALELARRIGLIGQPLVNFRRGALLHDIGKMGVPDTILFKPGKLTDEEWVAMKRHTVFAQEMLLDIGYLRDALDIPYSHHERWDGSGYPQGLKGEEIPLAARIFAVADVYDALTSDRPYRKAWAKEKAVAYIREESGKLFDPNVVDIFLKFHLATKTLESIP